MKLLAALGLGLTGLTALGLVLLMPWEEAEGVPAFVPPLVAVLSVAALVYFAAVSLVLRQTLPKRAIWIVLIVAAAIRLPVLFTPPILSSDVYRYIWDGRVQLAGINPYLFMPIDPALADLRDNAIYTHINRADDAHTIYPPAAQIVFAAVAGIAPSVFGEKTIMVGFEALAIFCALRLLALARLPPERVLIYAWNPLAVWSFAGDGHLDAIGMGLLASALLLRCLKRDSLAGVAFGAAVLVKFFPVAVGPALWRRGGGWRLAAAGMVAMAALYACYAGAGWQVFGSLAHYGAEEGFDTGSGVWLLGVLDRLVGLPSYSGVLYAAAAMLTLGGIALWIMTRARPIPGSAPDVIMVCGHAAILAACATVAISPHYPWYFVWLALPAVVRPYRSVIWLSTAPILLFITPFDEPSLWRSVIYVPAAVLALADFRRVSLPLPWLAHAPLKGTL